MVLVERCHAIDAVYYLSLSAKYYHVLRVAPSRRDLLL